MSTTLLKRIVLGVLLLSLFPLGVQAQTSSDVAKRRAQLEAQLKQLDKQEAQLQAQKSVVTAQSNSIQNEIDLLDTQIKRAQVAIEHRNLVIGQLQSDIGDKESTLVSLSDELGREKASLAQLLRKTNEIDHISLVEVMLGNQHLSEFFDVSSSKQKNRWVYIFRLKG